jgi:hypothetical protein
MVFSGHPSLEPSEDLFDSTFAHAAVMTPVRPVHMRHWVRGYQHCISRVSHLKPSPFFCNSIHR